MKTFEITEKHLKLLPRLYFYHEEGGYDGSPCVDQKRPYGNSNTYGDVLELVYPDLYDYVNNKLDGEMWDYLDNNPEVKNELQALHESMYLVLQIICVTGKVETGTYQMKSQYDDLSWVKVN